MELARKNHELQAVVSAQPQIGQQHVRRLLSQLAPRVVEGVARIDDEAAGGEPLGYQSQQRGIVIDEKHALAVRFVCQPSAPLRRDFRLPGARLLQVARIGTYLDNVSARAKALPTDTIASNAGKLIKSSLDDAGLTNDDEDRFAALVLNAMTELLVTTSAAYTVRIETATGKIFQHSRQQAAISRPATLAMAEPRWIRDVSHPWGRPFRLHRWHTSRTRPYLSQKTLGDLFASARLRAAVTHALSFPQLPREGCDSMIASDVVLGEDVVIHHPQLGAGAVAHDVAPFAIVAGVPAKILGDVRARTNEIREIAQRSTR